MKTYKYTNPVTKDEIELTEKPTNLRLRRDSLALINNFIEFAEPYTRQAAMALANISLPEKPDPSTYKGKSKSLEYIADMAQYDIDTAPYKAVSDKYYQKVGMAMSMFLLDEENLREVFEQFLTGDFSKIDFTAEDDEACKNLIDLGTEVLTDFFEKGRKLMTVLR